MDKYYEYGGSLNVDERGLTIGGYESAWLADLVAAFILETSKEFFVRASFFGIYRDDGIVAFRKQPTTEWIVTWLELFQSKVNELCETEDISFTAEIWQPSLTSTTIQVNDDITIVQGPCFPYLDMTISWNCRGELRFKVYTKPNQQLKYLNKGSCHTHHCFTAIPRGVFGRLARLTSKTRRNLKTPINELYPDHT